jgi:hypothetical protein
MDSSRFSDRTVPRHLTLHVLTEIAAVDDIGRFRSVREIVAVEGTRERSAFEPITPYRGGFGLI